MYAATARRSCPEKPASSAWHTVYRFCAAWSIGTPEGVAFTAGVMDELLRRLADSERTFARATRPGP